MNGKYNEAVGMLAGTMTTGSFAFQVYSVWHHAPRPAHDVSFGMFFTISIGMLLWIVYGCKVRSRPVIFFNVIAFAFAASIVIYKVIYG